MNPNVSSLSRLALRTLLVPAFACALAPLSARADIYMWTDERGQTVISDNPPVSRGALRNFETVVKEPERSARKSAAAPTRTEQLLLDKIENLERQLSAQRYTTAPPAPPPAYSGSYYSPPPPAPSYDPYYYSGYYPPYGPVVISSPFVIRRGFGFGHRFATRGTFGHHHGRR